MSRSITRRARRATSCVLCVAALAASACSSTGSGDANQSSTTLGLSVGRELVQDGAPETGGALAIGVAAETNGWNPAFAQWAEAGNFVGSSMFEPLFVYDADANLVPWLAESISSANDFTEWTVKIRPGIKFHNGTPVNADAFVKSISIATSEGLSTIATKGQYKEVVKVDDLTFKATLVDTQATWDHAMAGNIGLAIAPEMFDDEDHGNRNPIGTGAYVFDQWRADTSLRTKRNPDYWGGPCALPDPGDVVKKFCQDVGIPLGEKNGPFFESLEFKTITDEQQRLAALEAGDINVAMTLTPRSITNSRSTYQVITDFESEKTFVQLNTAKAPFDNKNARLALAHATDPKKIAELVAPGEQLVLDSSPFTGSSKWGLPNEETGANGFDLAKAREAVEAYKKDTGATELTFPFLGIANVDEQATVQALQQQWSEAGITATIDTVEQTQVITRLISGAFSASLVRNYAYPDPGAQSFFFSEAAAQPPIIVNFSGFTNDLTEGALEKGRTSTDFDTRKAAYDNLVRERNRAVTEVWLFNTPYALLSHKNVRGLNPFRIVPWGNFLPKPYLTHLWMAPE